MDLSSVDDMCALESVLSYHHCHGYLIIIIVSVSCYITIADVLPKFLKAKGSQNLLCTHPKLLSIDIFYNLFPS